jgi:hypothetical protein
MPVACSIGASANVLADAASLPGARQLAYALELQIRSRRPLSFWSLAGTSPMPGSDRARRVSASTGALLRI